MLPAVSPLHIVDYAIGSLSALGRPRNGLSESREDKIVAEGVRESKNKPWDVEVLHSYDCVKLSDLDWCNHQSSIFLFIGTPTFAVHRSRTQDK